MDVSGNCMYPLETKLVHELKRSPYYLTCLHLLLKVVQIDAMFFQIEILQGGRIWRKYLREKIWGRCGRFRRHDAWYVWFQRHCCEDGHLCIRVRHGAMLDVKVLWMLQQQQQQLWLLHWLIISFFLSTCCCSASFHATLLLFQAWELPTCGEERGSTAILVVVVDLEWLCGMSSFSRWWQRYWQLWTKWYLMHASLLCSRMGSIA